MGGVHGLRVDPAPSLPRSGEISRVSHHSVEGGGFKLVPLDHLQMRSNPSWLLSWLPFSLAFMPMLCGSFMRTMHEYRTFR